jgi:hypothetical protein
MYDLPLEFVPGSGELVRDALTGELRRANAQGKSMRLVDADEAGLDCLDWQVKGEKGDVVSVKGSVVSETL